MSRIGNQAIIIPQGVTLTTSDGAIKITGPGGELSVPLPKSISFVQEEDLAKLSRKNDENQIKALHGLTRSLLNNAIIGVTQGYQKKLELVGTGYRVRKEGEKLILSVGFSHEVPVEPTDGIKWEVEGNNAIFIKGIDKHLVGQVAANIRKVRPPEPYKGKGIRYENEVVRRKAGKAAKSAA